MTDLTTDERRVIVNALYTAAEKYRECAKEVGKYPTHEWLVPIFKKQADDCAELVVKLEE
jgi:hypothetical protein